MQKQLESPCLFVNLSRICLGKPTTATLSVLGRVHRHPLENLRRQFFKLSGAPLGPAPCSFGAPELAPDHERTAGGEQRQQGDVKRVVDVGMITPPLVRGYDLRP